jgi:hypothetical protein
VALTVAVTVEVPVGWLGVAHRNQGQPWRPKASVAGMPVKLTTPVLEL